MNSSDITVIKLQGESGEESGRLEEVLLAALDGLKVHFIHSADEMGYFTDKTAQYGTKRLLFAVCLGKTGINPEYYRVLRFLREIPESLEGFTGGVVMDGDSDLYTKSAARELTFTANCCGCTFVGRPLV